MVNLYKLCVALGVEFGNSVMHNSWYFHKDDNAVADVPTAVGAEEAFIRELLLSTRSKSSMRIKDYMRAYFNLNILNHLKGEANVMTGCVAGSDLFFVDPWGNVTPCNGSADPWIMGNLKDATFDEIWASDRPARSANALVLRPFVRLHRHGTLRHDQTSDQARQLDRA